MHSRFLFFLYFLPPAHGTAPLRNARIAKALASKAAESIAFTAQLPSQAPAHLERIEIRPLRVRDYRFALRKMTKDGYLPERRKKGFIRQLGVKLINTFPFNYIIGEGGYGYFKSLLTKGSEVIREKQITHMYSSFRPFADHYAAYKLKRKFPHLIWIADFRDVIVDPHTHHIFFPQKHQQRFSKLFAEADFITTVSEGLAIHLRRYNPNVIVIRNGIEADQTPCEPNSTDKFTICYTGSMFLGQRDARPLFTSLASLMNDGEINPADIKIIYAGKDGNQWDMLARQYQLEPMLENRGIIPLEEARQIQCEACVNVLLTTSSQELQGVFTGKWIEYVASGSPVLGIITGQRDPELDAMCTSLEIGTCYTNSEEDLNGIRKFLLNEYSLWKACGSNRKPVNEKQRQQLYGIENTMAPLVKALGIE